MNGYSFDKIGCLPSSWNNFVDTIFLIAISFACIRSNGTSLGKKESNIDDANLVTSITGKTSTNCSYTALMECNNATYKEKNKYLRNNPEKNDIQLIYTDISAEGEHSIGRKYRMGSKLGNSTHLSWCDD